MTEEKEELLRELKEAFNCYFWWIKNFNRKRSNTKQTYNQIKSLIEGKVSDKFVEKWEKIHTSPGDKYISSKEFIKALLEDYRKELMGG